MNLTNEQLTELTELAQSQVRSEKRIADLEQQLSDEKDRCKNISETLIPEAMMSVGMESFKLADGTAITVAKFYSGSIKEENADAAFQWLRTTGNDSLIKREVKLSFGKGEDNDAQIAVQALRDLGYTPTDKQSVHPMTLKSFIREQMEEANPDFPAELFGAFVGNKTKIAPAKK